MCSLSLQVFPSYCTVYGGLDFQLLVSSRTRNQPRPNRITEQERHLSPTDWQMNWIRAIVNHQNHRVRIGSKAQRSFTFSKTQGQTGIVGHLSVNMKDWPAASSIQALNNRRLQRVERPNKGKGWTCEDKRALNEMNTWLCYRILSSTNERDVPIALYKDFLAPSPLLNRLAD